MTDTTSILGDRHRQIRSPREVAEEFNRQVAEENRREALEKKRRELERKKREEKEPQPETAPARSQIIADKYILMPRADTYALGVHALRRTCLKENNPVHPLYPLPDGHQVYRPLTFLENILARINDYNTLKNPDGRARTEQERLKFFNTWLDSCCGVAYKTGSTKLKLKLQCRELIDIDKRFAQVCLSINYRNFSGDVTLDSSSPNFVRDGWLALLEGREDVYSEYQVLFKSIMTRKISPNFYVKPKDELKTDELLVICINNLHNDSLPNGAYRPYDRSRFLRAKP